MNKYADVYNKAKKWNRPSWRNSAIAALAADIEKATGKPVKVCGPFGLRAEMYIEAAIGCLIVTRILPTAN